MSLGLQEIQRWHVEQCLHEHAQEKQGMLEKTVYVLLSRIETPTDNIYHQLPYFSIYANLSGFPHLYGWQ